MFTSRKNERKKMDEALRAPTSTAPPPSDLATLTADPFFGPYRSLLPAEEFREYLGLISQRRASRESRYYVSTIDGKLEFQDGHYMRLGAQRSHGADLFEMEIMLVEDVDVRCLMALDAAYKLDPQFLLAYTGK